MAGRRTPIRPALLASSILRDNLRGPLKRGEAEPAPHPPEIGGALSQLDRLAEMWSALDDVRNARDPLVTREAAALRYRAAWERAAAQATAEVRATAARLMDRRAALVRDARRRAGLVDSHPEMAELRAVLRSMSREDRDAAIVRAAETGDALVLSAAQGHPLLVGETTIPVRMITDGFVAERAREEMAQIADIATAEEHLEMAYASFSKSAVEMRDLPAETAGEDGRAAAAEAEARLSRALVEPPAAP